MSAALLNALEGGNPVGAQMGGVLLNASLALFQVYAPAKLMALRCLGTRA